MVKQTNIASKTKNKTDICQYDWWLCRYAFDTFDANHDGSIDFEEFLLAITATSQGDLNDRLEVAFDL